MYLNTVVQTTRTIIVDKLPITNERYGLGADFIDSLYSSSFTRYTLRLITSNKYVMRISIGFLLTYNFIPAGKYDRGIYDGLQLRWYITCYKCY